MLLTHDEIELLSRCVTAISSFGTFLVAASGLRTWRRQIVGARRYEVAHGLLEAAFRLRGAIAGFRAHTSPMRVRGFKEDEDSEARKIERIYEPRWQLLRASHQELLARQVEATVLWGEEEFGELIEEMSGLVEQLKRRYRECIGEVCGGGRWYVAAANDGKPDEILFADIDPDRDPLASRVSTALEGLERKLRPRLREKGF